MTPITKFLALAALAAGAVAVADSDSPPSVSPLGHSLQKYLTVISEHSHHSAR